jgi:Ca2+:H+ antiporter
MDSSRLFPFIAVAFYAAATAFGFGDTFVPSPLGIAFAVTLVPILFGTVFAAVHHADVIAERTGEPFGTLVLTVAVTVIEVALIVSIMLGDEASPALARDTVFAVVMIVCNGLVGLCIFIGGLHHREQYFVVTGASAYLAVLVALSVFTLVLPNYTLTTLGPIYAPSQLAFISAVTIALYAVFLYIQTIRHREYFVGGHSDDRHDHAHVPSNRETAVSAILLLVALTAVILLAKKFASVIDIGLDAVGAPAAVAGVIVALLILMPEGMAAVRAARADELQRSINLALGSSLATIGLTIPAVAAVSVAIGRDLVLGLGAKEAILLALTIVLSLLTFGTGRTNILYGFVHLVVFATFVFLVFVP